ncbi:hypothetical protein HMPREF9511_00785 [Enterococcus faecalis TX0630]|uniref:Uncharacterized protein n=1 Tax=Enterococcus faecalis TX0630 TaxID=749508 RepID=A0ABC9P8S2_ENTFL|nr:hypothetical protein HMPREF9511_00785 [Enterococcus faecalis TX0630]
MNKYSVPKKNIQWFPAITMELWQGFIATHRIEQLSNSNELKKILLLEEYK